MEFQTPFLTNVCKEDYVESFFHGFWYIGLMMAHKMDRK
jgi:hypothetical protein